MEDQARSLAAENRAAIIDNGTGESAGLCESDQSAIGAKGCSAVVCDGRSARVSFMEMQLAVVDNRRRTGGRVPDRLETTKKTHVAVVNIGGAASVRALGEKSIRGVEGYQTSCRRTELIEPESSIEGLHDARVIEHASGVKGEIASNRVLARAGVELDGVDQSIGGDIRDRG